MKTLKNALNDIVTIYWWNMGKKTLDFTGTYADFFKEKGIRVKLKIGKADKDTLKIWFSIGVSEITLSSLHRPIESDYYKSFDTAIKIFLLELGDKAEFTGMYNRTVKINWR
jgi:hypothetical protein